VVVEKAAMTRSLYFAVQADGRLGVPATMEQAALEVLSVPEDHTGASVLEIAESVVKSGAIALRARAGTRGGPIRISWAALIEKGLAAGVLEEEEFEDA
jgi:hypothetical protein